MPTLSRVECGGATQLIVVRIYSVFGNLSARKSESLSFLGRLAS